LTNARSTLTEQNLIARFFAIFAVFLRLGISSFGGPIAHLGYFQHEFVVRRKWLDAAAYADLVALCQFLPGPASSQVGFALGLLRGGFTGGCAAWLGFTAPSVLLLMVFAYFSKAMASDLGAVILHGLKIVAVAVVAQAVWSMTKTLCPDRQRASIALSAVLMVTAVSGTLGQISAILLGALAVLVFCRSETTDITGRLTFPLSCRTGLVSLGLFFLLLAGLPLVNVFMQSDILAVISAFYRTGALVFGGGHVVLPLLQAEVVQTGWVDNNTFLNGYGAAQAVPGPLFTFAAYLGALMNIQPNGLLGGVICLISIFLPGLLLLIGMLPFWDDFRRLASAKSLMRGVNAAVVGLLGSALYSPLWTSSINNANDFALALLGFVLLTVWKVSPFIIVIISTSGAVLLSLV
jgi:chromate transporter